VGTLLETFQLTSDVFPTVNLVTANLSGLTLLTGGNKYWLEADFGSAPGVYLYTSNTTTGRYGFFDGTTRRPPAFE
jgi:hypothetical protein